MREDSALALELKTWITIAFADSAHFIKPCFFKEKKLRNVIFTSFLDMDKGHTCGHV